MLASGKYVEERVARASRRAANDEKTNTVSFRADSRQRSERDVAATIQRGRRGVGEHATPQSGRDVDFSTNC
jgi:hypothetical protein